MKLPLELSAHEFTIPAWIETRIRSHLTRLVRLQPSILRCRVHFDGPGRHHRTSALGLTLTISFHHSEIVVSRKRSTAVETLLHQTFAAARRQLVDHAQRQHGSEKHRRSMTIGNVLPS